MTDISTSSFGYNPGNVVPNTVSRGLNVPTKILELNLTSGVTEACLCFTQQQFSEKLQAYMINYVISVSGLQAIYS